MRYLKNWIWVIVLILLLTGCVVLGITNYRLWKNDEVTAMENTKLVLYDGPKSLKDATEEDLVSTSENLRDISLMHSTNTKITVNGEESYVYETNVNHSRKWSNNYAPSLARTPVTYFDFDGVAKITVQALDIDIQKVQISPIAYGIEPEIDQENHTVTFTITEPDTYTVLWNDSCSRAVHIFANSMETELPDFESDDVIYIGPGEWTIDNIVLEDNQTLYLAGGAVLHGCINANFVENVTVMGRGIIDGSIYEGWQGTDAKVPLKFDNCTDISIRDVLVLNSNAWVLQGYDTTGGTIEGVKIISCRPNGDGISLQSCENFTVSDCFVRTWDDSLVVKNYDKNSKNICFKDIQIWTDLAQSMEIGYETNKGKKEDSKISDIIFEDILVLHNFHKPVISVHNADDAIVSDITFRNIVVEDAQMGQGDGNEMPYLIDLHITQNTNWSSTKDRGQIKNIQIENITVLSGVDAPSRIQGYDEEHIIDGVEIKNLTILGEVIDSLEDEMFEIDSETTENLIIHAE